MKPLTFNTGIPTAPDVDRLEKALGIPDPGDVITYDQICSAINEKRESSRYGSVVSAWRKRLLNEHDLLLLPVPKVGLKAASASEMVHFTANRYKGHLRGISRCGNIAIKADTTKLTTEERKVQEHLTRASAALRLAAATEAKKLKLPDPNPSKEADKT